MKPYRIALIVSLACLLAAVVWVLWQRVGPERAADLNMDPPAGSFQKSGSALKTEDQTPVQNSVKEQPTASADAEEGASADEKPPVQYDFRNWQDAMGAYAELAGQAYDRLKRLGAPESVLAMFDESYQKEPAMYQRMGKTRAGEAETWVRHTAVDETFEKLETEYRGLLDAMIPFLNDIPFYEWRPNYVLARAGRIPLSEAQDLVALPNGDVINLDEYYNKKIVIKFQKKMIPTIEGVRELMRLEAKAANPSTPLTASELMQLEELRNPGYAEHSTEYYKGNGVEEDMEELIIDLGVVR